MASGTIKDATVIPAEPFNPELDAEILRKAMKGWGTDENAIIAVLSQRSADQRQEISTVYSQKFSRNLIEDLKSEISGKFEKVTIGLMTPRLEYLAKELRYVVEGGDKEDPGLVEILVANTRKDVKDVIATYNAMYEANLEDQLDSHFGKVLMAVAMASREDDVNEDNMEEEIKGLKESGRDTWSEEEGPLDLLLTRNSHSHIRSAARRYVEAAGRSLEGELMKESGNDFMQGAYAIIKCITKPTSFFAERLHKCMQGAGTDDRGLIRLILTRCEIDLRSIKREFEKQQGITLETWIAGEVRITDFQRGIEDDFSSKRIKGDCPLQED